MKIGLLGGSFNPPHEGHCHISLVALKKLKLDRIWWIVTPGNPLKSHKDLTHLSERVKLCQSMANHPKIDITDFESIRKSPYTAESLAYLKKRAPQTHFIWIMGADNLKSFHKWKRWQNILKQVPLAIIDRPSYRYSATSSRFAIASSDSLINERNAPALPYKSPPCWALITDRLLSTSSTELRTASKNNI